MVVGKIQAYTPYFIVENISQKAINLMNLITIEPGQIVNLYACVDEFEPTKITPTILRGLEIPHGDIYVEQDVKGTIKVHRFDAPEFHYSILNPENIRAINDSFPGAVPTLNSDGEFEWLPSSASAISATSPLNFNNGALGMSPASFQNDGYLTKEDYALLFANIKPDLIMWQYQDFPGPVSSSLNLTSFDNGISNFDESYILSDSAVVVSLADPTAPATSVVSLPGRYLPSNRIKSTSHIGDTVILNKVPDPSMGVRVYYRVRWPAARAMPTGYEEDPVYGNNFSQQFLDLNYLGQNEDEDAYGVKTFHDDVIIDGKLTASQLTLPNGASDGYLLTSDGYGRTRWASNTGSNSIIGASVDPPIPIPGKIWVKIPEYEIYLNDETRGAWQSSRTQEYRVRRDSSATSDIYLFNSNGKSTYVAPISVSYNATIITFSAIGLEEQTWTVHIRKNNSMENLASLEIVNARIAANLHLNLRVNAFDRIQIYMEGTDISYPSVQIVFSKTIIYS